MRKIIMFMMLSVFAIGMKAADMTDARKVLDKCASIVGNKGGAQASFKIAGSKINSSGTIAIKGNKFNAVTPQATMWYNGQTQWTYMKQTNEVNISTPSATQQAQMNPLNFISMYKKGYNLSMKTVEGKYEVHMTAQNGTKGIQEAYIVIDKKSFVPTQVRMRQKDKWTTINISNFQAKKQNDAVFTFKKADFPTAEIVDLR